MHVTSPLSGIENELQKLKDVSNQRLQLLRRCSKDAFTAVQWLRNNRDQFKDTIHDPIMTVINVKDAADTRYVESHIAFKDMTAFVCENKDDQNRLLEVLREQQGLRINVVGTPPDPLSSFDRQPDIGEFQ